MRRWFFLVSAAVGAVALAGSRPAVAQPGLGEAVTLLLRADEHLRTGKCDAAAAAAGRVAGQPQPMPRPDRAEAWRIYGLSLLCLGQLDGAEKALLEFLKLDPDARLDPDLVAPDDVAFFERVRLENRQLLDAARPPAERRRIAALNLLPPFGQFQNRQRLKGWLIAGTAASLLATNVATYAILEGWCGDDGLCTADNGDNRNEQARVLKTVNALSGVALVGVIIYGIADGYYVHFKQKGDEERRRDERLWVVTPAWSAGVPGVTLGGRF